VAGTDGEAEGRCVAGAEGAGVVLGAVEAKGVGGVEVAAEAVVGDGWGVPLAAAPPQAVRPTAIAAMKVRLRMRGPYKSRLRLDCGRHRQGRRGEY
jgi:hypothetical protein